MSYAKQWRQAARQAMNENLAWTHLDTWMVEFQRLTHSGISEYEALQIIQSKRK